MTVKIYEYGLLPPTVNAELVDDQMRAAHRYRNVLVELERERRTRVRAILSGHADTEPLAAEVERLASEHAAARERINLMRSAKRRRAESAADRLACRELGARL